MRVTIPSLGFLLMTCLTVLLAAPFAADAAEATAPKVATAAPEYVVVHIEVSNLEEITLLDREIDVWHVDLDKGLVEAAVNDDDRVMLRELGFPYEIDQRLTEKYDRPFERVKGQVDGIPGYPCYRTVEETHATGAALAAAYPDLAEWIDIGDSWEKVTPGGNEGYDLMILRLTNTTNGIPSAEKPKLWAMGSIHARELVTAETATRFAEHLLANYDVDPDVTWVLDHHEIHILLVTNPDGRKHAETGAWWRKNTNENYCSPTSSDRGADLNRNCDFYWAQSTYQCGETYPGPSAASEPETQAMHNWLYTNFPDWRPDDLTTPAPDHATGIFIDIHSHGGDVFGAFVWQPPPAPNDAQSHRLGRKFTFFTSYDASPGGGYGGSYSGTTKDFGYGRFGMPAYTFELGTEFFEECAPFEETIYPDNLQALLYAARAVRAPYTQSSGPEVVSPEALPSVPGPGETITVTAVIDDTRYGPGASSPPISVEAIAAAELYIDVPPWRSGAAAIPMSAVDGVFDSTTEAVTAFFGSSGLSDGRHTVFIRGQDSAGYWGTVRADFIWVLDPSTAAHIAGRLTDSESGLPVEGTVTAGVFSAASGPATGSYDLLLPAGTYDVTAMAPGHYSTEVTGVVAIQGNTTTVDFALDPYARSLFDDVEGGNIGWTTNAPWGTSSSQSHSPVTSWTESPIGDSPDSANISLTSPPLDLRDSTDVRLSFWHRYAIESGWDYGRVEWSPDGGTTWHEAASYSGTQSSWTRVDFALPGLDGSGHALVRFRYTSDSNTNYDGWYIDDISIEGSLFSDGFESGSTTAWAVTLP